MTLNEITTEIAARLGKELDMQYRQWLVPQINAWRSRLIRNTLEKRPSEKHQFLQSIKIPLTYGNYVCASFECYGSYSESLPRMLRIGETPFEYLGSVDMKSPYRFNDMGTSDYVAAGKTAGHFINYLIDNNRVIIPGKRIAEVKGAGIFDEPEKVSEWQCQTEGSGCDWWNAEYPITGDILAILKQGLWEELGVPREVLPQKTDTDE